MTDPTALPELKACPFCGGKARPYQRQNAAALWFVSCENCDASPHADLGKKEAIARWNTRALPEDQPVAWPDVREALAPFAKLKEHISEKSRDSRPLVFAVEHQFVGQLTVGDIRRIAALYTRPSPASLTVGGEIGELDYESAYNLFEAVRNATAHTWHEITARHFAFHAKRSAASPPPASATGNNTCYVERSKVREAIIAATAALSNGTCSALLKTIDALPIFNTSDFTPASADTGLVKALEPFAEYVKKSRGLPDNVVITNGSGFAIRQLTIGDCRKAAAALAAHRGGE